MTIEELKEMFCDMQDKGLSPLLCDTEIPKYDVGVPCGEPLMAADPSTEYAWIPRELLSMNPEFMITVKGDSMKDAGIVAGDMVKIVGDMLPSDGDIVLACIDSEYTLKSYCEDEEGMRWLVPQNERFNPILLDDKSNVRIVGVVSEVIKRTPRVSYKQCMRVVNKWKLSQAAPLKISKKQIAETIKQIAPMIDVARQWYAVYRAFVDKSVVSLKDYDTFIEMVVEVVPQHPCLPSRTELNRMAVQSFAKPVQRWTPGDAPVKGKRFADYQRIAIRTEELLMMEA